jgi:hypothetical protein
MQYCRDLASFDWERLPDPMVRQVAERVDQLQAAFDQVRAYAIGDAEGVRDDRAQQVRTAYEGVQQAAIPLIGFLSWKAVDVATIRQQLASELEGSRAEASDIVSEVQKLRTEATTTLEAIRAAAAEAGVAAQAQHFDAAAKRYEKSATRWLRVTICAGGGTAALALLAVFLWERNGAISDAAVLQLLLAKAVVLAIGLYFTTSAARVYRANSHLTVVNRHRHDALLTFRAFVAGAGEDAETKNKILIEATHAAFSHTPTGLLGATESPGVLEILDGTAGSILRKS